MKYSFGATVETLAWVVLAVVLSFCMVWGVSYPVDVSSVPSVMVGGFIVGAVLAGAALFFFFEWLWKHSWFKWFSVVLGVFGAGYFVWSIGRVVSGAVLALGVPLPSVVSLVAGMLAIVVCVAVLCRWGRERLRVLVPFAVRLNNLLMVLVFSFVAAMVSWLLSPLVVVGVLLAIALYDAWAVWKSGHMQRMAFSLADAGIIPGIAIFVKAEKGFDVRLLGGGDVLFLCLVPLSFVTHGWGLEGIAVLFGMVVSLVWLLFAAKKGVAYPAIPFLFGGFVAGFIGGVIVKVVLSGLGL